MFGDNKNKISKDKKQLKIGMLSYTNFLSHFCFS